MKKSIFIWLVPAAATVAWLSVGAQRQAEQRATGVITPAGVSILVSLGVQDTQPTDWSGTLTVTGGEVTALSSRRPHPEDKITGVSAWTLSSRRTPAFQNRSWEDEPMQPYRQAIWPASLVVRLSGSAPVVSFRTAQGSFQIKTAELAAGQVRHYLDGKVTAELVPTATELSSADYESEFVDLIAGMGDDMWAAWTGYRKGSTVVFVRRFDGARWMPSETLTKNGGDVFQVRLARDGSGGVWAVWSEQVDGNWDLYARRHDGKAWGPRQRLTEHPQPDIFPALATASNGHVWLAWQGFRDGKSDIFVRSWNGIRWTEAQRLSESPANDWQPAVAADSKGRVHVVWDTYHKGDYDVMLRTFNGSSWSAEIAVARSPKFEAHATAACDKQDRLWVAWTESGLQWGKDTGLLVRRQATPLYKNRLMAVAIQTGQGWRQPAVDVESALPEDLRGHNESLLLKADQAGRMWLFFRRRFDRIPDVPVSAALHGAAFELYGVAYEGDRWSAPIAVPFSQGRSDMPTAAAVDARGRLHVAWATDGRDYDAMTHRKAQVFSGIAPAFPGTPRPLAAKPRLEPELRSFPVHPREQADVQRMRDFTLVSQSKTYRVYRGDIHRHTEISRDGKNDGSLIDTYRYAMDAAELDFLGVSDHNNQGGPDLEYINWLNQQLADVFHVAGKFVPLFGYERSVGFPNGHRNVMFARRGAPTYPIPPEEQKAKVGAKGLYEYLKRYGGIAVSHTPATNMGTDWRDNDPEVEPLVEIYQGDRVSAEHEGAPKAASRGDITSHAGGFRPEGYVWNAWAKGYKLGVQASSDHLSTHISYACTIATEFTRQGLLDAMRARHSYGATDNILLDYRIVAGDREYLQGDIAEIRGGFRLVVKVIGTAPIRQIDIIRSHTYLHTRQNLGQEVEFTFTDNQPLPGESYYYVRVQQVDEQMAWSSPIWIRR